MKSWFIALAAAVFMGGCSTLEIQVDYDNEHDFSALSTFAVVYKNQGDGRDFSRDRISRQVTAYMKNKGYENVEKSTADFYVIMHLDVQKKSQVETNYETIGIRPVPYMYLGAITPIGSYPGTYVSGAMVMEPDVRVTTRTNEYEEGRLILEVFNVNENRVVWQGIAMDELSKDYTQQEKSDYINRVISELFKDFPQKVK